MTELVGGGYERLQMQLMVANDQLKEKDKEIEQLRSALRWCSGSADFHEGGDAEEGWRTICEPLLDEGNQKP